MMNLRVKLVTAVFILLLLLNTLFEEESYLNIIKLSRTSKTYYKIKKSITNGVLCAHSSAVIVNIPVVPATLLQLLNVSEQL